MPNTVYYINGETGPVATNCGYCGHQTPVWGMTKAYIGSWIRRDVTKTVRVDGKFITEHHQVMILARKPIMIGDCCLDAWHQVVLHSPKGAPYLKPYGDSRHRLQGNPDALAELDQINARIQALQAELKTLTGS